jgi:hypothetical protein
MGSNRSQSKNGTPQRFARCTARDRSGFTQSSRPWRTMDSTSPPPG